MSGRYQHEQPTPSDVWVIQHNLSTRAPIVDAHVDYDGVQQKMLPKEVRAIDLNTCHLIWSVSRTGRAGVV